MRYRMIFPCICVALAYLAQSGQALARCTTSPNYEAYRGLSGWPVRVQNSSNATLRAAYTAGTCVYLKGAHGGGQIPSGAASDRHVTVAAGGRTCHVFTRRAGAPGPYFPTTCI
jgi:hypothetical protein